MENSYKHHESIEMLEYQKGEKGRGNFVLLIFSCIGGSTLWRIT